MITRVTILLSCVFLASLPAAELRWYKGNTHTHSLWSDGNDFPDMISDWYRSQGYDFLAMSDHNTLARGEKWVKETTIEKKKITLGPTALEKYLRRFGEDWVQTRQTADGKTEVRLKTLEEYRQKLEEPGKFLLIEAEEISAAMGKVPVHINAINLSEVIPPVKDLATVREVMRANLQLVAEQAAKTGKPIIAHINHPNFQWALTAEDLAHVIEDRYFEVYNGHPKTFADGDLARASSSTEKIWDVANTIRIAELNAPLLMGVATDDSHHYHGGEATPGRGWVMVRSAALEADALVQAMKAGDFYASTGVVLEDVSFDKTTRKLRLKIKAEPGVSYTTEFRGTLKHYDRAVKEVPSPAGDRITLRLEYSPDVGKVLATSTSTAPEYALTGDELFVRATITSTKPHRNPVTPGQVEMAWTQPVR
jgi:hypothetical protein